MHSLSLFGLDTLVHRPHKMAVEDIGNVCIVLTRFLSLEYVFV